MSRKTHHLVLLGTICLLCSCIDNTYDLKNKEISLDMAIEGNKIAFPLGNLKPILLDSMLSIEDQELLKEINGVYSIAYSGVVDPIGVDLGEIGFSMPPISYHEKFNLEEVGVDLDELVMPGKQEVVEFNVADVSIEEINEALPRLQEKTSLDVLDSDLIAKLGTAEFPSFLVYTDKVYTLAEKELSVDFEYVLPKEVKSLHEIKLVDNAQMNKRDDVGVVVQFEITHPRVLAGLTKHFSFKIELPESFDVSLYAQAENADCYRLEGNTLTATNVPVVGETSVVAFCFNGFVGLQDEAFYKSRKNAKGEDERVFVLDELLSYSFDYFVNGSLNASSSLTIDDFKVAIQLDADFGLYDVIGDTNPIEFDFDDECISFSTQIDDLEYISEVKYVRLNPHESQVRLTIDMPETFASFELNYGESFKIHLPEFLFLNEQLTHMPAGMTYDNVSHTIHIMDDEALDNAKITLALDSISIHKPVVDGCVSMSGDARLTTGGSVYFAPATVSLRNDLPALRDKKIIFDLEQTRFVVEEVVIVSDAIVQNLHEVQDIVIDEAFEEGLERIYSIDFKEDVGMELTLELKGLEDINGKVDLKFDALLPPFICLESDDSDVEFSDGRLSIETEFVPGQMFKKSLKVTKFDFTTMEEGYLAPTIVDGKPYLRYTDSVVIDAQVSVGKVEVSSDILSKVIEVDADFAISPIVLSKVEGLYSRDLGQVCDSFELDLGDALEFLKDESNGLTLSDPQLMVEVENTFGIPLSVDVIIVGKDDHGQVIESAHIELIDLPIKPAAYDEATDMLAPDTTRYLFASHEGKQMAGYQTVVVPQLATLLQRIPSMVSFALVPKIDTSDVHRVDLSQKMQVSGSYSIVVPLMFDDLSVCYADTISGLQMEGLGEVTEVFSNLGFSVRMDVNNTMPIGLEVALTPIDAQGRVMDKVIIDPVVIKAGNGKAISEGGELQPLEIKAQSKGSADFSDFDGIIFSISANANETIGGAALKPEQGIHIKNIVIELRGDIEVDLNELDI